MSWAYTEDFSVPFNLARFLLNDTEESGAYLTDEAITSNLAVFGWQKGMAVMAQAVILKIDQEVLKARAEGVSSYEWATSRTEQLKDIKKKGEAGTLEEPGAESTAVILQGTMTVKNAPEW